MVVPLGGDVYVSVWAADAAVEAPVWCNWDGFDLEAGVCIAEASGVTVDREHYSHNLRRPVEPVAGMQVGLVVGSDGFAEFAVLEHNHESSAESIATDWSVRTPVVDAEYADRTLVG